MWPLVMKVCGTACAIGVANYTSGCFEADKNVTVPVSFPRSLWTAPDVHFVESACSRDIKTVANYTSGCFEDDIILTLPVSFPRSLWTAPDVQVVESACSHDMKTDPETFVAFAFAVAVAALTCMCGTAKLCVCCCCYSSSSGAPRKNEESTDGQSWDDKIKEVENCKTAASMDVSPPASVAEASTQPPSPTASTVSPLDSNGATPSTGTPTAAGASPEDTTSGPMTARRSLILKATPPPAPARPSSLTEDIAATFQAAWSGLTDAFSDAPPTRSQTRAETL